ncbi:RICIN domain-containing protein [Streptomyces sp. NPDC001928]|uniref:RICIN domain-containing protein n=1 Tax=Streptomyces sp. NPDC001928 TaxID=3154404 RepID=UPI00333338D2
MLAPRRLAAAVIAMILALIGGTLVTTTTASASPSEATYTISIGSKGTYAHPTDTPASTYIDKDGTFYFQQSAALYGTSEPRYWDFFTGTNFEDAKRSSAISDAVNPANPNDKNNDTTWRCNNSPTGVEATNAPAGSRYSQRNYCDLSGVWVDPDTGDWYGLVHNEFTPQPFGDGIHYDGIDYAVSKDQGRTWSIKGHAITSPYSTKRGDNQQFPHQTYYYGDGDQRLFVDTASGYFYVYYGSRVVEKGGTWKAFQAHVARAPISAKMAPASWRKWHNGSWSQPGVGGLESNMEPVTSSNPTGYTPVDRDYDPANPGTVAEQIEAGELPPTSPLFVMNIAYDAHLGLYIGTPEVVKQPGPQQYYVTDNLATQKWHLAGDSGSYTSSSWYRWFLDGANKTNSTIVGKTFRSYCAISCTTSDGEYANVTIDSSEPAKAPFDPARTYRIAGGNGRLLAQVSGNSATTSLASATGSDLEAWSFAGNGDGSYRITNAATGQLLGVANTSTTTRAWGTKPTVTAAGADGPAVGQQWFIIPGTSAGGGQDGTYRLLNRYSGLMIGMSADADRLAETTPARHWTNTTGNPVGGSRTAAEQALTMTAVGSTPGGLNGTHTLITRGKALDVPDYSKEPGTQLVTYTSNGGANQKWRFTLQPDGSYQLVNVASGLCADVSGASTEAGAKVIQWTCNGRANQRWVVTRMPSGAYTVASAKGGLLLTTASSSNKSPVTQETNTNSSLQHWSIV